MGLFRFSVLVALIAPLVSCEDLFGVPAVEDVQPNAPSRFTMVDYTAGVLTLRWEDASEVETGYAIEKSESMEGDDFTRFSSLAADSEEFQVGITKPARFRVAAFGAQGPSSYLSACLHYEDLDGDGSGTNLTIVEGTCPADRVSFQTGDCDDTDPARFPGNKDICDGIDNDCDGKDFPGVSEPCSVGVGECAKTGAKVCSQDRSGLRCDAVTGSPATEICDGKDNDCNGSSDEGIDCKMPVLATMPEVRIGLSCVGASNGKIYCFGGAQWTGGDLPVLEYDPGSDTVRTTSSRVAFAERELSCAPAQNSRIYCFGRSILEYDPEMDLMDVKSPVWWGSRYRASCVSAQDRIFCFGGSPAAGAWSTSTLDQIVEYDPNRDVVSVKQAILPSPRDRLSCAMATNSRIYCFGGSGTYPAYGLDQVVEYSPSQDSVAIKSARLPAPRSGMSCTPLQSGPILCFGGGEAQRSGDKSVLAYDPGNDILTTTGATLPSPRGMLSCAFAQNGRVYCFGGTENYVRIADVAEFDPQKFPLAPARAVEAPVRPVFPDRSRGASGLPMDPASDGPAFGCEGEPIGGGGRDTDSRLRGDDE